MERCSGDDRSLSWGPWGELPTLSAVKVPRRILGF
jgi:hypothetical protein